MKDWMSDYERSAQADLETVTKMANDLADSYERDPMLSLGNEGFLVHALDRLIEAVEGGER